MSRFYLFYTKTTVIDIHNIPRRKSDKSDRNNHVTQYSLLILQHYFKIVIN